jgi:hypothetical protein
MIDVFAQIQIQFWKSGRSFAAPPVQPEFLDAIASHPICGITARCPGFFACCCLPVVSLPVNSVKRPIWQAPVRVHSLGQHACAALLQGAPGPLINFSASELWFRHAPFAPRIPKLALSRHFVLSPAAAAFRN